MERFPHSPLVDGLRREARTDHFSQSARDSSSVNSREVPVGARTTTVREQGKCLGVCVRMRWERIGEYGSVQAQAERGTVQSGEAFGRVKPARGRESDLQLHPRLRRL